MAMTQRVGICFDIVHNEKLFTITVQPGAGLNEVNEVLPMFIEDFKTLTAETLEKERLAKEAAQPVDVSPDAVTVEPVSEKAVA
jgi:hypothetical protein